MTFSRTHRTSIRRTLSALILAAAGWLLVGCAVHVRPSSHHHHAKEVVVVPKGHVHHARCGHYRQHGRWYHLQGHVHKRGCGHVVVGGVWVLRG
jgi:hypothetical protein